MITIYIPVELITIQNDQVIKVNSPYELSRVGCTICTNHFLYYCYSQEHAQLKNCGLDLYEGLVKDNKKAGVFEPAISKVCDCIE